MEKLRDNIRHLMGGRSVKQVGDDSGVGQSWLHRFLNPDSSSGIKTAKQGKVDQLAAYFRVDAADLMFRDLRNRVQEPPASYSVGQEREIVAAAVKLVDYLQELAMAPFPKDQYATYLYVALKVAQEEGASGILDGSSLVDASRRFAARLRKEG